MTTKGLRGETQPSPITKPIRIIVAIKTTVVRWAIRVMADNVSVLIIPHAAEITTQELRHAAAIQQIATVVLYANPGRVGLEKNAETTMERTVQ